MTMFSRAPVGKTRRAARAVFSLFGATVFYLLAGVAPAIAWTAVCSSGQPAAATTQSRPAAGTLRERLAGGALAAHRGGSTRPDGNTLSAFERARRAGVDIIEMDLRLTKDGVPVVYHDPVLKRNPEFGSNRPIDSLTLAELDRYRVAGQYAVPAFDEVLAWADGRVVINAEFKTRDVVEPAIDLVKTHDAYEWVYFQTKSDPVRYLRAREHDPRVALLFKPDSMESLAWALGLGDDRLVVIELGRGMATPEVIEQVHAAGKLASKNAWHLALLQEAFHANADEVFARGIDIAVTKRPLQAARRRP